MHANNRSFRSTRIGMPIATQRDTTAPHALPEGIDLLGSICAVCKQIPDVSRRHDRVTLEQRFCVQSLISGGSTESAAFHPSSRSIDRTFVAFLLSGRRTATPRCKSATRTSSTGFWVAHYPTGMANTCISWCACRVVACDLDPPEGLTRESVSGLQVVQCFDQSVA